MVSNFTILPAIDLRGGKVVRLTQGDPARQTIYGDSPRQWAKRWKSEGADWLHVVNLDGAFGENSQLNLQALKSILTLGLNVELGGGIRDQATIKTIFDMGVKRVFFGTAAILNPDLVEWAIAIYGPDCVAGDIGVRNGKVTIKGWQETTTLNLLEVGQSLRKKGIKWCVLTDINRDGVGNGVNMASALDLQSVIGLSVVASGGVRSLADVLRIQKAGLAGVIIGRALYEGKISLADCLQI